MKESRGIGACERQQADGRRKSPGRSEDMNKERAKGKIRKRGEDLEMSACGGEFIFSII